MSDATLTVAEGGSSDHEVQLSTQPTDTVTVTISGDANTDLTLTPSSKSLTFTTSNWNTAQTVTVAADEDTNTVNEEVTLTLTGAGGDYEGETANLIVTVADNDMEGLTFDPATVTVGEGDSNSYTVRLATEPSVEVTVAISGDSGTDLTLGASSLTFTTSNWNAEQTVTVAADEDDDATNDSATLTHSASGGGYDSVSGNVTVTTTDNDTRGLTLNPTSLGITEGNSGSYTVALKTRPTSTVTVAITGHAATDLTLTPSSGSLTFTTSNWDTVQTVTVEAGEDDDADNDSATLAHNASGGDYGAVSGDVTVNTTDNDTRGLTLSPTSLGIIEGNSGSYTVALKTQPTSTVTVAITGHASTDLTLTPSSGSLTFTTSNWDTVQTVTVEAGEDDDADNDSATLAHNASGGDYGAVSGDVTVNTTDNDSVGLVFNPTAVTVNEGSSSSYTVRLATEPTAEVTVAITQPANTELTLGTSSLTFSTSNWNAEQTVTVAAGEDDDSANDSATLTHNASNGGYGSVSGTLTVTTTDNDPAALVLSPTELTVNEGGSGSYTVKLATEPTNTVTVAITMPANTDLTLTPAAASLTFTTSNWNTLQTVTVAAGQDADAANDIDALTHTASGGGYGSVSGTVTVTVTDDETADLVLNPTTVPVNEGNSSSYTVALKTQPTSTVTVAITGHAGTELTLTPASASLTFTTSNWNAAQTVTVAAGEDGDSANESDTLAHNASGGGYDSISGDVIVNTTDNDNVGLVLNPGTVTVNEGDSGSYTVALETQPTSTVTVAITGQAGTDLTLTPAAASLTFTTSNWNAAQTVTVAAGEDGDSANDSATLAHNASGGGYDAVSGDVTVNTTDNDTAGLVLSPTAVTVNEGGSSTYTVKLATEPTTTVTVAITGDASTDLTLTPPSKSLTFTTSNWGTAQTVTVAAGQDDDADNDSDTLTHTASGGDYEGETADLVVTVTDDDTAPTGITLTASPDSVAEGGGAQNISVTATIDGSIRFTEAKTVAVSVSDGTATSPADYAAVSQFSITINAGDASASQPFTLTPADDTAHEPTETINVTGTSTGLTVTGDEISITDDDTAPPTPTRITLTASPDSVAEGGGAQTITVTATIDGAARFTASQTVDVGVSDGTATSPDDYAAVSGFSITIDAGDASASQTFTLTPVDDAAHESTETINVTGTSTGLTVTGDEISITDDDNPPAPERITLTASPDSVAEGGGAQNITVTAAIDGSARFTEAQTVAVSVSDGTATSPADYAAVSSFSITINAGEASASHPFTLTPVDDAAHESTETINVTGTSSGLTVTPDEISITDNDDPPPPPPPDVMPRVWLTAAPNPHVPEGDPVAVTLHLTKALEDDVTVPLVLTAGTAEPEDFGSLASITISAGDRDGTDLITTAQDDDQDDETFTVAIGALPAGVELGEPDDSHITIVDDDVPPPNFPPTVTAACEPCRVPRGGQVRLTATASDPDGDPLTYAWSAPAGRFDGPTDGPTARWIAPDKLGPVTIRVEVADGFGGFAMAEVIVNVVNRMPVFEESVHRFNLPENRAGRPRPIELGTMTATDPDGDTLTYEQATGDRTRFAVRASGGIVTYIGPGEDFEVEPNRYLFAVRVEDAHGAVAVARVIVTVTDTNEQPVAHDDTAETREDQPVTVAVLANDTDPDGDDLRVATVSAPAHGDTAISADGGVSYRPRENYHGADRFTYVVTDPDGETATATVAVTVRSVNDAPVAVGRIPDQALDEGGGGQDIDLAPFFDDIDGDALTYRAEVSDTDVATAAISGSLLTLTPVVYGSAAVTVTAEDDGGLTATQTFAVGVDDRLVRGVLDNTLAAMARSHLASARMTLGRRIQAGGSKRSRLTVAGQRVPLSKGAARQAADQLALSWLSSAWGPGMSAHGLAAPGGPAGVAPAPGTHSGSGFGAPLLGPAGGGGALPGTGGGLPGIGGLGGFGGLGGLGSFGGFGGGSGALLRNSEFELALGGQDDGEGPAAPRWGVWGQGDIQTFRGTPDVFGYEADYAGDVQTGYVGVDARLTDRWLTGVAVARSAAGSDWQVGASSGQLKTTLTALHPYAEWSDGATSIWMMAGGGWGEAENVRDANGRLGTADLGLRLGLVDLRRRIGAAGGAEFALRADAAWAQLSTGDGGESVDSLAAAVNQQRVGGEVSGPFRLGGLTLAPFGEAHLRRDGGAGQNGTGMELGFGLRAQGGIVRIDAQGRVLAVHSAAGYRERGAGVTLTIGGQEREGLSLSVSPRWGDAGGGTGALWQDEVYRRYLPGAEQDEWAMDARGEYGMKLPSGQRLTWFGNFDRSRHGHRFLVGAQMGWLSDALLSRGSHQDSAVDHGDNVAGGNPPVPDR